MPTYSEIIEKDGLIKCQSNLIDFAVAGTTNFEFPLSDLIAYLNLTYGGNYKFKRSKIYLVVKEYDHNTNYNLPAINIMPAVVYDINMIMFYGINFQADHVVEFTTPFNLIIEGDMTVNVSVAATGFTAFTGYIVVEGSFINMDL